MGLTRWRTPDRISETSNSKQLARYSGTSVAPRDPLGELADHHLKPHRNPWQPQPDFDPVLVAFPREYLCYGHPTIFRQLLYETPRAYAFVARQDFGDGLNLLSVEPRLIHPSGDLELVSSAILSAQANPPPLVAQHLTSLGRLWSELKLANLQAPSEGAAALSRYEAILSASKNVPLWSGLAWRNKICILAAQNHLEDALATVQEAKSLHPNYRELDLLHIWLELSRGKSHEADQLLVATDFSKSDPGYVYSAPTLEIRALWLRSRLAALLGWHALAYQYLMQCLASEPWDPQWLDELGRMQPPAALIRQRQPILKAACWLIPNNLPQVRTLLKNSGLDAEASALEKAITARDRVDRPSDRPPMFNGLRLEGEFFSYKSLARVNRALALELSRQMPLQLVPSSYPEVPAELLPEWAELDSRRLLASGSGQAAVTIRHFWPHDFSPVSAGRLAIILPWEMTSLPRQWHPYLRSVDEVWVPSTFGRNALLSDGFPAQKVHVVPNGVNPQIFCPSGDPSALLPAGQFNFLYVGGLIWRKGVDLLVEAFCTEFSPDEPATLLLKAFGAGNVYGTGFEKMLRARLQQHPQAKVRIDHRELTDMQLAALYRSAGAVVQPYRGEGFGLPILEAMACGRPVIATGAGACLDFCNDQVAYLLAAEEVRVPDAMLGDLLPTVHPAKVHEVRVEHLRLALREVYREREAAASVGARAAVWTRAHFTWQHAAQRALVRIQSLLS